MSNESDTATHDTPAPDRPARSSSTLTKVVQAAALAAVLVPLGSVAVETSTINCSSSYSGCVGTFSPGNPSNDFDFGGFSYILTLHNVMSTFGLSISADLTNQTTLDLQGRFTKFPGAKCVDMLNPQNTGDPCVDFGIFPFVQRGPTTWDGFDNKIAWDFDSNTLFPNGGSHQIVILHDFGTDPDLIYDENMCAAFGCTYFPGPGDPGISSMDTDFQHHIVASLSTEVPEPSTLVLIGSGLSGFLYRRRRRRNAAAKRTT